MLCFWPLHAHTRRGNVRIREYLYLSDGDYFDDAEVCQAVWKYFQYLDCLNPDRYEFQVSSYDQQREEDLYGLLGVPRNATSAQIKRAYMTQIKKWHPDTCRLEVSAELSRERAGWISQVWKAKHYLYKNIQ